MLEISILEIISIITAFQLLMLGIVLLSKKSIKRESIRILSLFMFSNFLLMVSFIIYLFNIYDLTSIPVFYYLLGPLMYLYVLSMCTKNFIWQNKYWIHGLLFIIMVLIVIIKIVFFGDESNNSWQYFERIIAQGILHVQIACYIIASFIIINKYRIEIKNHYAAIEKINLSWLMFIIIAFATMWGTDFIAFVISISLEDARSMGYYLVTISITINLLFANYLVYRGLRQPDAFSGIMAPAKYSGSKITEDESMKKADQLVHLMQNKKLYLNPNLTIKDLSEETNIHYKFLSQIINSRFGQNFYDFVNQYRIDEAKEIMKRNTDDKKTILEILYEVGFNSKSAFNNAFKKNTGQTPSEFKKTA